MKVDPDVYAVRRGVGHQVYTAPRVPLPRCDVVVVDGQTVRPVRGGSLAPLSGVQPDPFDFDMRAIVWLAPPVVASTISLEVFHVSYCRWSISPGFYPESRFSGRYGVAGAGFGGAVA